MKGYDLRKVKVWTDKNGKIHRKELVAGLEIHFSLLGCL